MRKIACITLLTCTAAMSAAATAAEDEMAANARCEKQRLACEITSMHASSARSADAEGKAELCWDKFYDCTGESKGAQHAELNPEHAKNLQTADNEEEAEKPAQPIAAPKKQFTSPKAMKHFVLRSNGEHTYKEDCFIIGNEVTCKGNFVNQPSAMKSYDSTFIGKISGSVISGTATSLTNIAFNKNGAECTAHEENNWNMKITLGEDNKATIETGPAKARSISSGIAACQGTSEHTYPANTSTLNWHAVS